MNINGIGYNRYGSYNVPGTKGEKEVAEKNPSVPMPEAQAAAKEDVYVPSVPVQPEAESTTESTTGEVNKLTSEQVEALEDRIYENMKSLVEQMIGVQIGKNGGEDDGSWKTMTPTELADFLGIGTKIEAAAVTADASWQAMTPAELADFLGVGRTPEAAAAAIADGGMWGVDAVSTRLMDMAIHLSGGDVSKAEMLREAVQEGFAAVGALDSLPQVCRDTYAETMKRFDYWIENGSMDGYGATMEDAVDAAEDEAAEAAETAAE